MKAAILGFADHGQIPADVEIWTMNHAYEITPRIDLLVEMHPLEMLRHRNVYEPERRRKYCLDNFGG